MKRILMIVFAFVITMYLGVAIAESALSMPGSEFDPSLANSLDYSSTEWFKDEINRNLLTVILALDMCNANILTIDQAEAFLNSSTYVGDMGALLLLGGQIDNRLLYIYYFPILKTASYYWMEDAYSSSVIDITIQSTLKEFCSNGYYKNSSIGIRAAIRAVISSQ